MTRSRLGCLTATGLIAALLTLLVISGAAFARGGVMFSPGPLNAQAGAQPIGGIASHAESGGRCELCHAAAWDRRTMADLCLECHTGLLDQGKFHVVMLAQAQEITCRGCHSDHRGAEAPLTVLALDNFPHDQIGFSLAAHQKNYDGSAFVCKDCHGASLGKLDQAICSDCHASKDAAFLSAHQQAFPAPCLACHDGVDRFGKTFSHQNAAFQLEGKHAQAACAACHAGASDPAGFKSGRLACRDCHAKDDPHGGRFGSECSQCHTPAGWATTTFDHNLAAFKLTGAHTAVACADCHKNGVFQGTPADCYGCHAADDHHAGQFGTACGECHTPDGWEGANFDHTKAAFQLTGKHLAVACEGCHVNGVFKGTPMLCYDCHANDDRHGGQFGTSCENCHTPEGWAGATFDHSQTSFALTGAHASAACTRCHVNNVFAGTPSQCVNCHAEPGYHQGLFGLECNSCHNTSAWRPAAFNGPHRFPLGHGGAGKNCALCHPTTLRDYTCYGCHEHNQGAIISKHREEGISNVNNCVRCHPTGQAEGGG